MIKADIFLAKKHLILLKKRPKPNLEIFQKQIYLSVKNWKMYLSRTANFRIFVASYFWLELC